MTYSNELNNVLKNNIKIKMSIINSNITLTGVNSTYTLTGVNSTYTLTGVNQARYVVFGKDVFIDSYWEPIIAQNLALINVLGKPFYEELIKNGFSFHEKIVTALKEGFISLERDTKIGSILESEGKKQ